MPHDLRLGEPWTRAQAAKNHVLYAGAMLALGVATRMPRALLRASGGLVAHLAWLSSPALRRSIAARAPAHLGARRVLVGLGRVLADTVLVLTPARALPLSLRASDRAALEAAIARGRGVVYATAHLGAWEAMGPLLASHGFGVATVARESYDPRFDAVYARLRTQRGVEVLYRGKPGFARALVRSLRAGRVVGFPMDLAGRGVRAIQVPWFGSWTRRTPIGPAELAFRLGAAVVVGTPAADAGGPHLHIEEVSLEGHDAVSLTRTLAERLSARIEALPAAWPWGLLG